MTRTAGHHPADDLEFPDDTARQASMDHAPSGATAPERPVPPEAAPAPLPLVLSAGSDEELRTRAAALRDLLASAAGPSARQARPAPPAPRTRQPWPSPWPPAQVTAPTAPSSSPAAATTP
ncbi:hypothetical protein [Streptomyces abikoensis]